MYQWALMLSANIHNHEKKKPYYCTRKAGSNFPDDISPINMTKLTIEEDTSTEERPLGETGHSCFQ